MYLVNWLRTRDSMVVQRTVVRDEPEQKEDTEQEELQKDWEERLKERKKELRQISHQILRLQERGVHLATEAEEKKNTDRKSAGRDPGVVLSDLGGRTCDDGSFRS